MAQIENETYKIIKNWKCPNCGRTYLKKKVGIVLVSATPRYIFCSDGEGCARYFTIGGIDITKQVEEGFI